MEKRRNRQGSRREEVHVFQWVRGVCAVWRSGTRDRLGLDKADTRTDLEAR